MKHDKIVALICFSKKIDTDVKMLKFKIETLSWLSIGPNKDDICPSDLDKTFKEIKEDVKNIEKILKELKEEEEKE